jgi:hypothetical protein
MGERLAKSDAGRREIGERQHALSRPARNLLLIIDSQRPALEWVGLVQGCTEADLHQLRDAGLIEPATALPAPRATKAADPAPLPLDQLLAGLTYDQLYALLTAQARERLGLIKGYKLILDVEKCSGIDELRALGLRFAEQLRASSPEAIRLFREAAARRP